MPNASRESKKRKKATDTDKNNEEADNDEDDLEAVALRGVDRGRLAALEALSANLVNRFDDVRFHTLRALVSLCDEARQAAATGADIASFCRLLHAALGVIEPPPADDEEGQGQGEALSMRFLVQLPASEQAAEGGAQGKQKKTKKQKKKSNKRENESTEDKGIYICFDKKKW